MVERAYRPQRADVTTFHTTQALGGEMELGAAAAHHAHVKRLTTGQAVRVTDGQGQRAGAEIVQLGKQTLTVRVDAGWVETVPPLPYVELWAPVGDRERMLWLAEKVTELGVSAWRPVMFHRSRSVSPRGEGAAFAAKVGARMIGALEQSGGAWLPAQLPEVTLEQALAGAAAGTRLLLDAGGERLERHAIGLVAPVVIALGPEGGMEPSEHERCRAAGWRPTSLGDNVLRFETAGIAAVALVRSLLREA